MVVSMFSVAVDGYLGVPLQATPPCSRQLPPRPLSKQRFGPKKLRKQRLALYRQGRCLAIQRRCSSPSGISRNRCSEGLFHNELPMGERWIQKPDFPRPLPHFPRPLPHFPQPLPHFSSGPAGYRAFGGSAAVVRRCPPALRAPNLRVCPCAPELPPLCHRRHGRRAGPAGAAAGPCGAALPCAPGRCPAGVRHRSTGARGLADSRARRRGDARRPFGGSPHRLS